VRALITHPIAPVTLLLAHAIELYIKSYLRLQGLSAEDLKKKFGHDFRELLAEASSRGLLFDVEDKEVAAVLTEQESIRHSRYIETGSLRRPSLDALSRTCRSLDETVSTALKEAGESVRENQQLFHIEGE
jgi:hypothetical protein